MIYVVANIYAWAIFASTPFLFKTFYFKEETLSRFYFSVPLTSD
jgi:hypothetical protein